MAVEAKRGCGYRKSGGTYLIGGKADFACDRLPLELSACPCCGGGIKQARGWTWIAPEKLFGDHECCVEYVSVSKIINSNQSAPLHMRSVCPVCKPYYMFASGDPKDPYLKAALLWVGEKFYTADEFMEEARTMGISKRIATLPKGVDVLNTWVFIAHPAGKVVWNMEKINEETGQQGVLEDRPAIITAFRPQKIERIVDQSELDRLRSGLDNEDTKKLRALEEKGVELVPVPDDDPDHH